MDIGDPRLDGPLSTLLAVPSDPGDAQTTVSQPARRRLRVPAAVIAALAIGAAFVGTLALPGAAAAAPKNGGTTYYVSLGDSYSVGYQPVLGATPGYTAYVARKTRLTLVNFGCGGATTTSILHDVGCPDVLPHTAGGMTYPTTTQAAAAEAFITAHAGHVGLITVSIGGNDVTACASAASPVSCVATADTNITTNVTALGQGLRAAAGPKVPIIGLTYPDVILGEYVYPSVPATASRISLAKLSVIAFKSLVNPTLAKAYRQSNAAFVDVTAATGAYIPLTKTTSLKPYGTIPVAVANVCTLTWFCALANIHARSVGYSFIGKLIVTRYATMPKA
jgi:lysophospholipase L1-like esterase